MTPPNGPQPLRASLPRLALAVPLLGLLLAALPAALGQADKAASARARTLAEAQIRFSAYLFPRGSGCTATGTWRS